MTLIQRIGLASAFKVGLAVYGCVGLIAGIFCSAIAFAGIHLAGHPQIPFAPWGGLLALVLCPLIYGLIGGIGAIISAFLYNLASGWVGGVEVEIR